MTDYRPVIPVPPDAPAPDWDKLRPQEAIGDPVKIWTYHTAEGGVAFYVARWLPKDPDDDKVIRPATWDGSKWRLKGMPAPRPFYRLPDIPMICAMPNARVESLLPMARPRNRIGK